MGGYGADKGVWGQTDRRDKGLIKRYRDRQMDMGTNGYRGRGPQGWMGIGTDRQTDRRTDGGIWG